jgi:hypothetical protein
MYKSITFKEGCMSIKERCMASSMKGQVQIVNEKWHMTSLLRETCGHFVKKGHKDNSSK